MTLMLALSAIFSICGARVGWKQYQHRRIVIARMTRQMGRSPCTPPYTGFGSILSASPDLANVVKISAGRLPA